MIKITLCEGEDCKQRNTCERFTSKASQWETWFDKSPLKENGICDEYISNDKETEIVEKELWDHYSELPNPAWYEYKEREEVELKN